jgi:hypothetical protein
MRISRSHTRDAYERNLAQIQPLTCGSLRFVEVPVAIVLVGVSVALCCRCRAQLLANVYNGGAVLGATECWINRGEGFASRQASCQTLVAAVIMHVSMRCHSFEHAARQCI